MRLDRRILASTIGVIFCASGLATAQTKAYAITATNVMMPMSGIGSSAYTVTGIPMTGTLIVSCQYSGPTTMAKIPTCTYGPLAAHPVTAGQTFTGNVSFYPYGSAVPAVEPRGQTSTVALGLAAPLFLGLAFWRRRRRGIMALALCLVALAGIAACGGTPNEMTSGTYPYTITADNEGNPNAPLGQGVSATINVTVP